MTRELLEIFEAAGDIADGYPGPIQAEQRWLVERTQSWMNGNSKLRRFTDQREVIVEFYLHLVAAPTVVRRLINSADDDWRS